MRCLVTNASNVTNFFERRSKLITLFGCQFAERFNTIFGSQVESYLGAVGRNFTPLKNRWIFSSYPKSGPKSNETADRVKRTLGCFLYKLSDQRS